MGEAALIKEVGCARSSVRTLIYLEIAYTTKENNFTLGLFFPAKRRLGGAVGKPLL